MWTAGAIVASTVLLCLTLHGAISQLIRVSQLNAIKLDDINSSLKTIASGLSQFFKVEFEANEALRRKQIEQKSQEIDAILKKAAKEGTLRIFDE